MMNLKNVLKQQLSKLLKVVVALYRVAFAQFFGGCCRFSPSCSCYAQEALEKHGPIKACILIVKRISKCHPLGSFGYDPVPDKKENCYE